MNGMMVTGLIALAFTVPAQAQREHARYDFPYVVNGQEHVLTYEGTHDVTKQRDTAVKLVVLVHHGGSQNPVTYFKSMKGAFDLAAADRPGLDLGRTTMIIAPGMVGARHIADNPARYSGKHYPHWDNGWREGAPSINTPQVSNFDLLDGMVVHIADRFPGVKAIVHVGHSAGGQLLSRYAFGTPVYDVLRQRGIVVRYIISNPSSVLYFDRQRPDLVSGKGFIDYRSRAPVVAAGECHEFNTYKYGLDGMVPYMTRRPVSAMLASFRTREVFLFLGLADTDPNADGLDNDCPAMLQGRFRLERGQRYYEYLGHYFGPDIYKTKFIAFAPGIGHNAREMFSSAAGKSIIFINADSAAAAVRQNNGRTRGEADKERVGMWVAISDDAPDHPDSLPGDDAAQADDDRLRLDCLGAGGGRLSAGGTLAPAVVAGLRARGAELVGALERYEDGYRLCYVRGPEGIIVELAERIG